jgi:hypothetical protein
MRRAASSIARVPTLCETSTAKTIDSRDERVAMTGRASAAASAARSADRTAACRRRWRTLKFVRASRCAAHTSGIASSSQSADGAVQVRPAITP